MKTVAWFATFLSAGRAKTETTAHVQSVSATKIKQVRAKREPVPFADDKSPPGFKVRWQ